MVDAPEAVPASRHGEPGCTGNTTISKTASYTGTTTVNGGTLTMNATSGGGNGFDLNSVILVLPGGTLALNAADTLGYNVTKSATISGVLVKTNAQSETLGRPITLSGGTMTSTTTSGANGAWNFFGNTISTAPNTANYITGVGQAGLSCVRALASISAKTVH